MTPQYFHTAPTSCGILPTIVHTTKLITCTLAYSHPLNRWITTHQQGTQHCSLHSLLCTRQPVCDMFNSNKSSQHNSHFNMPYKLSNAHGLHSFCIQDRPDLPCSVVIKLQPPTTGLLHVHQHALHTHAALSMHSTAFHNSPMCTNNKHKAQLAKWHKMCHSHLVWLVFEGSIPACTCFYSENVLVTLHI